MFIFIFLVLSYVHLYVVVVQKIEFNCIELIHENLIKISVKKYKICPKITVLWIRIRIQVLCGSRSVFRIRIHTCKYRINKMQKVQDLRKKFTIVFGSP